MEGASTATKREIRLGHVQVSTDEQWILRADSDCPNHQYWRLEAELERLRAGDRGYIEDRGKGGVEKITG